MRRRPKSALRLATAQIEGGAPWGEVVMGRCSYFICQNCGTEYRVSDGLDPCAFCNDCKDEVLDTLAQAVVDLKRQLPKRARR